MGAVFQLLYNFSKGNFLLNCMSKEGISCMYPPVHVMCIAATQGSPISDNSACHGVSAGISPEASPLLRLTLVGLMPTEGLVSAGFRVGKTGFGWFRVGRTGFGWFRLVPLFSSYQIYTRW